MNVLTAFHLRGNDWGLLVGPSILPEALPTVCVDEVLEYRPEDVVQTLLAFPALAQTHPAQPTWSQWMEGTLAARRPLDGIGEF